MKYVVWSWNGEMGVEGPYSDVEEALKGFSLTVEEELELEDNLESFSYDMGEGNGQIVDLQPPNKE